jgi:hypothetical protein
MDIRISERIFVHTGGTEEAYEVREASEVDEMNGRMR